MRGALLLVALAGASAGCSGDSSSEVSPAPTNTLESGPFADCTVTLPMGGVPDEIDFEQPVRWVARDMGWYGNTALWVSLPPDGLLPSLRADDGVLHTKFPWWRLRRGSLAVRAVAVDDGEPAVGTVPDGYGDLGFTPSDLRFSSPGCWRVTGVLDDAELSFVVWVCETDDYSVEPDDRQACGAV